jgi:hypothetical protein
VGRLALLGTLPVGVPEDRRMDAPDESADVAELWSEADPAPPRKATIVRAIAVILLGVGVVIGLCLVAYLVTHLA